MNATTKAALELISNERLRQIVGENCTPQHDDSHNMGELAQAAACYALPDECRITDLENREPRDNTPDNWPWDRRDWKPTPKDRMRELTKAGALVVAEMERLMRKAGAQ